MTYNVFGETLNPAQPYWQHRLHRHRQPVQFIVILVLVELRWWWLFLETVFLIIFIVVVALISVSVLCGLIADRQSKRNSLWLRLPFQRLLNQSPRLLLQLQNFLWLDNRLAFAYVNLQGLCVCVSSFSGLADYCSIISSLTTCSKATTSSS